MLTHRSPSWINPANERSTSVKVGNCAVETMPSRVIASHTASTINTGA